MTPVQATEAMVLARHFLEMWGWTRKHRQAAEDMRRLIESGFVGAAMEDCHYSITGEVPDDEWCGVTRMLDAYRRLQGEK